ncbi:MAG TPA: RND family transporter, partial [Bacteroidales bacterium]|nr:RND family transporter [Bacteroidales bacterium]
MWTKLAGFILRYRAMIIITLFVLTLGMIYNARNVKLSYEYANMLPEKDTAFLEFQKFKSYFGEDANIMVIAMQDHNFFELEKFNNYLDVCDSVS